MRTLRARLTAVTVMVAVVAIAITGMLSVQLVRSSTTDDARRQLSAQAQILAKLPRLASVAELDDKTAIALGGTLVAFITADGMVEGSASDYVDAPMLAQLAAGESVSVTRRGESGLAMIEARPARDSTAIVLALPTSAIDRTLAQVTARILFALAIGLSVAIVGATLLARRLSKPLTQTAEAARRLAAGERGVAIPGSPTTELAAVSDALTSLDAALMASEGRQREFLLSISHELRTPLTAVRGYAEAFADGLIAPEKVAAVGRTLTEETERIDRFVGDLLELARLEADDFSVSLTDVSLQGVMCDVVAAWKGRAAVLGASLSESTTIAATAHTDARRLRQVIDGLVENALRAGGNVELRASDGVVEVLDTGPGFEPSDLALAFRRGELRARYRDVRVVGTGLGLSIAARLVERLGGTIAVENRAEGGAVFTVRLG